MPTLFASTLPKPHKPKHRPKLCQRACKANARKIVFKKFPDPSKKIKNATHSRQRKTKKQTMTLKLNTDNGLQRQADRTPAANSVLPQLAVTCKIEAECSYQTFVQVDSEVLRNRQLRQHAKR